MSRLPSFSPRTPTTTTSDLEQPPRPPSDPSSSSSSIVGQMPQLADPELLEAMTRAISDVSQARAVLKLIGERPTHEEVDNARAKLADLEAHLSRQLEEIVVLPKPPEVNEHQWRAHLAERENHCKESVENDRRVFKSLLQLEEMHDAYAKLLKDAEKRLVKIYEGQDENGNDNDNGGDTAAAVEEEHVAGMLQDACGKGVEHVDLSGQHLRTLPEAFGRIIPSLVVLNLSTNQLLVIPDSISGLQNLEELNVSTNVLESLPDSIGLLQKLKILNVSGNKLSSLPDSISQCRSLVELDASFNSLQYLPTNIGYELQSLKKLLIQLNKIRSLPSSICEMKSLRYLDAHFNELHGLPIAFGKLSQLEVLNLSSNFSDLKELPETFGDLISLRELDLSNNQILALPDTFGRLDNLTKLNLEQNPLELPPVEIVNHGVQAIKTFMAKRWIEILAEKDRNNTQEFPEEGQNGWLTRSTSWLKTVSGNVTEYLETTIVSPKTPKTPKTPRTPRGDYLNQQL